MGVGQHSAARLKVAEGHTLPWLPSLSEVLTSESQHGIELPHLLSPPHLPLSDSTLSCLGDQQSGAAGPKSHLPAEPVLSSFQRSQGCRGRGIAYTALSARKRSLRRLLLQN